MLHRSGALSFVEFFIVIFGLPLLGVAAAAGACTASTPAGDFDLAPLGVVKYVTYGSVSEYGWTYLFSACGDIADLRTAGARCSRAAPAAAVQATDEECFALGLFSRRRTAPLTTGGVGVTVAFDGGHACGGGTRNILIDIVCADVERASSARVFESRACAYNATVESRAGCPLSCARDAETGAVCGGEGRGVCAAGPGGGAAACRCEPGHSGPSCAAKLQEGGRPAAPVKRRDSCRASTPAGDFDLALMGTAQYISHENATYGWNYLFSACADIDVLVAGLRCAAASPASAVQATDNQCFALGRFSRRRIIPLSSPVGVTVFFDGGDVCGAGTRSITINVLCADLEFARSAPVLEGPACTYTTHVESRAGCPLSCARDPATGAVCSGEGRGVCAAAGAAPGGGTAAACVCESGFSGPACAANAGAGEPGTALVARRQDACRASTSTGDFDLSPLGVVQYTSYEETSMHGWVYLLSACANVNSLSAGHHCAKASPASAVQATDKECFVLGRFSQRQFAPLVGGVGVKVAFEGGSLCPVSKTLRRMRSIEIIVECADVELASNALVVMSTTRACAYVANVESRAGCPLSCARDPETGAVCGGEGRGVCSAAAGLLSNGSTLLPALGRGQRKSGRARKLITAAAVCRCEPGHSGPICAPSVPLLAEPPRAAGRLLGTQATGVLLFSAVAAIGCSQWLVRRKASGAHGQRLLSPTRSSTNLADRLRLSKPTVLLLLLSSALLMLMLSGLFFLDAPPPSRRESSSSTASALRAPPVPKQTPHVCANVAASAVGFNLSVLPLCVLQLLACKWPHQLFEPLDRGPAPDRAAATPAPLPASIDGLRVYVTTTRENSKRQRHVRAQLQRRGLAANAHFVTAFDSSVLPFSSASCLFGNFSRYAQFLKPLTPGEASNSLKQVSVAFDVVLSGAKAVLVLEDDVYLAQSFASVLDLVLRTVPDPWDAVFLSQCYPGLTAWRKKGVQVTPRLWRTGLGRCADAYLLSARGARKVLSSLPMRAVFDWHVNFIEADLLWLEPFAAWQDLARFPSLAHSGAENASAQALAYAGSGAVDEGLAAAGCLACSQERA